MSVIHAGDLDIHYIQTPTEGDIPVVLVHGNWSSARWWQPVLDRLPTRYSGFAYDMRGRGETAGPDNGYTMPEMAADLRAFADALKLERFHVVGHSLGSAVAMEFALESPERLLSLTALSPAWVDGMPAAYNVPASQEMLKNDKNLFATSLKALAPNAPEDDTWRSLVEEGHQQRLEAALRNLPALVDWHPGDALRATGLPSLVIYGPLDPLTGGAVAERAAEALGANLVLMEGVGHSPNLEVPDRFVELITEHFAAAEPSR